MLTSVPANRFSPEESRMLKNILGLRERRVGDATVPPADIMNCCTGHQAW